MGPVAIRGFGAASHSFARASIYNPLIMTVTPRYGDFAISDLTWLQAQEEHRGS
jgi:hypothetical protein